MSFIKICNENGTKSDRIKIEWRQDGFNLFIIEQTRAWFSEVRNEHVKALASQHDLDKDLYYENVKNYICNNHTNVSIEVKDNEFVLYRQKPNHKLRLKYFVIKLAKMDYYKAIESFLDDLNAKYIGALHKLKVLQDENEEIVKQKILVEEHCSHFVELKQKADLEMYSAFALTLNEKKQRIRFLTELLEKYTNSKRDYVKTECPSSSTKGNTINYQEPRSDRETNLSEGYNTDDEKMSKLKIVEDLPSTSKEDYGYLGGNSPPMFLPKRAKIDESVASSGMVIPAVCIKHDKQIENSYKHYDPQYDADTDEDEAVEFNTQDFLDKM